MCLLKKEKNIEKFLKHKKGCEREVLWNMHRYLEGKIQVLQMINCFKENSELIDAIFTTDKLRPNIVEYDLITLKKIIHKDNVDCFDRVDFARPLHRYFLIHKVKVCPCQDRDSEFIAKLLSYFPEWVCPDERFFFNIMKSEMPKDLTEEDQASWCKNKILGLYKYKQEPPVWVQNSSWPFYKGEPMIFLHQKEKNDVVYYYFIDKSGKKKKRIVEYY